MTARDHTDYQNEIGAYLLGALTDLEHQAFERHMAGCTECRDEVERLRPAADALPRSVEPVAPPPSLRASLMQVIERESRERSGETRAPWRFRLPGLPPSMRPALAAGALAIGLLAGYGVAQLGDEDESARSVVATVDENRLPAASAQLQLHGGGEDGAILRVQGMPPLPDGVYQAWVLRDGTVFPQPTFEVGEDGTGAVAVPDNLSGADVVLVTREPPGGARAPSEEPVLSVPL